jgi:hypothetical protein
LTSPPAWISFSVSSTRTRSSSSASWVCTTAWMHDWMCVTYRWMDAWMDRWMDGTHRARKATHCTRQSRNALYEAKAGGMNHDACTSHCTMRVSGTKEHMHQPWEAQCDTSWHGLETHLSTSAVPHTLALTLAQ